MSASQSPDGSGSEPELTPNPPDATPEPQDLDDFKSHPSADEDVDSQGTFHERSDSQQLDLTGNETGSQHSDTHINRRKSSLVEMERMMQQQLEQYGAQMGGMGSMGMGGSVMSEYEEIAQVNDDKQYFSELFDKIDLENNGDVDGTEFRMGLERIGVYLDHEELDKLFVLLDADASGYIDRNEWVNFLMQPFQNPGLRDLQEKILGNVRRHSRSGSNLIKPTDVGDLTATELNRMHSEMSQHMSQLVNAEIQKVQEEEHFLQEIEEAATDPNFCKPENAGNWDVREVVYWLDSLKFGDYIRAFTEEGIDGSILLADVNRDLLERILAVKPVHVSKMLREIDRIRDQNEVDLGQTKTYKDLEEENLRLQEELDEAREIIKEQEEKLNAVPANPMASMMSMNGMSDSMGSAQTSAARGSDYNMMNPLIMMQMQMMEMNQKLMNSVIGDGIHTEKKPKKLSDDEDDADEKLLEVDAAAEIERLQEEILAVKKSKIELAVQTQEEIASLREIITLLSESLERETTTTETPGGFASFLSALGLNGYAGDDESDYSDDDRDRRDKKDRRRNRSRDRGRGDRDRDRERDRRDDRDDRDRDRDRDRYDDRRDYDDRY